MVDGTFNATLSLRQGYEFALTTDDRPAGPRLVDEAPPLGGLAVRLSPRIPAAQRRRAARCLEIFQDYCVVTESDPAGLEVAVVVDPAERAPSPA
jgi:hypothetical protein